MSNVFSETYGYSIEQFYIRCKIEKAKTLLAEKNAVIRDIASQLNYSSNAHFSAQFKTITGISPSDFKRMHDHGSGNVKNSPGSQASPR
jgi:AraC-like DNA-binding protein